MSTEPTQFKSYLKFAQEVIKKNPKFYKADEQKGILSFAKYLDSGKTLGSELVILALQRARQIDRELILELGEIVGRDKLVEVARAVNLKHRHSK